MFTKNNSTTIKNYIEVIFAAILIVFGISFLAWNQGNNFSNMGATAFLISGVMIIIKANWEHKNRRDKEKKEDSQ